MVVRTWRGRQAGREEGREGGREVKSAWSMGMSRCQVGAGMVDREGSVSVSGRRGGTAREGKVPRGCDLRMRVRPSY